MVSGLAEQLNWRLNSGLLGYTPWRKTACLILKGFYYHCSEKGSLIKVNSHRDYGHDMHKVLSGISVCLFCASASRSKNNCLSGLYACTDGGNILSIFLPVWELLLGFPLLLFSLYMGPPDWLMLSDLKKHFHDLSLGILPVYLQLPSFVPCSIWQRIDS